MNKLTVTAEPGLPIIRTRRSFDAPRDKVFAAFVEKEKLEKWWLGPGYNINIEVHEPRDGGRWRYVQTDESGGTYTFHGNFHEVSAPERIIWTFEFEPLPERGHVSLERIEFIEDGPDTTTVSITSTFLSVADRDGMVQSGMENGLNQSYENLDKVLEA